MGTAGVNSDGICGAICKFALKDIVYLFIVSFRIKKFEKKFNFQIYVLVFSK